MAGMPRPGGAEGSSDLRNQEPDADEGHDDSGAADQEPAAGLIDDRAEPDAEQMQDSGRENEAAREQDRDTESRERCTVGCLLYTSPSPRDVEESRMPSSA